MYLHATCRFDSDGRVTGDPVAAVWSVGENSNNWVFSRLCMGEGKRKQRLYWDPQYFDTSDDISIVCVSAELQYIDKARFVDGAAAVEIMKSYPLWARETDSGDADSWASTASICDIDCATEVRESSVLSGTDVEFEMFLHEQRDLNFENLGDFDMSQMCYEDEMALFGVHQNILDMPMSDSHSSSSEDGLL